MASVTATPEGDQQAPSRLQAWQQAVDTALAQVGQDLDADQVALYDLAFCAAQLSAAGALHRWAQRTEEDQRLVGLDLAYQADVAADISHRLNRRAADIGLQPNQIPDGAAMQLAGLGQYLSASHTSTVAGFDRVRLPSSLSGSRWRSAVQMVSRSMMSPGSRSAGRRSRRAFQ